MQKFKVKIEGVTPYLQHRMDDQKLEQWEKKRGKIIERDDINKEDAVRAEFYCYRNSNGENFIPSEHIRGALINAGSFMKGKVGNARKSMKNQVAAMFMIEDPELILPDYNEVDKRSAVNKNVKARIVVIRPKWSKWNVSFNLLIDDDTLTIETITQLIDYAGNYVGIGSFRPTNNGMFGRFKLLEIKKLKI